MSVREPEFLLSIECDHRGNGVDAEPETVALIGYVPNRYGAVGFLEWREYGHTPGQTEWALQTYFGEAHRLGTFGVAASGDEVPGMDAGQRWRFHCSTCGETKPVLHKRIEPILTRMREANVTSLTLALMAAML